jgi:dolichyl-phosphate beta-glucosyltransferase
MLLSIILPAYNEEARILSSITRLRVEIPLILTAIEGQQLGDRFEVIVINDGSSDRTGVIVEQYISQFPDFELSLINLPSNRGKGYAVKTGVASARGKYIAFMDADLSTPPIELCKLIAAVQQDCAIAIGSRGLPESQIIEHQPIYRELMGKTFNLLVRLLVINGIHDTQCGFKLFRAQEAKQIFGLLQTMRFGFDVEILLIAQELEIPIREVPIAWRNSAYSSVSAFRDSWEMFYALLQMKQRVRRHLFVNSIEKNILHGK